MPLPQEELTPDYSSQDTAFKYLDGVGNHELKNLLASLFLADPEQSHTASSLARDINEGQGEDLAWEIKPTAVIQFCERSLQPVGAVLKDKAIGASGKEVSAWQANPQNADLKLALAGFLGDWSLRWADLSVQQAYGITSSVSERRSPQVRHGIYSVLLNRDGNTSLLDIANDHGGENDSQYRYLRDHVDALAESGIVTKTSKYRSYDPHVKINDEGYSHIAITLENTIPETQALYKAIGQLGAGNIVTLNQIIDQAQVLDSSIDTIKLRRMLRNGVSTARAYPGLELLDSGIPAYASTHVELKPNTKQPISELTSGVEAILNGQEVRTYIQRAREILYTPDEFAELVTKARFFSPRANSPGKLVLSQQLETIVRGLGDATVEQTRHIFHEKHGRQLSGTSVRAALNTLVGSGALTRQKTAKDPHSHISSSLYSASAQPYKA